MNMPLASLPRVWKLFPVAIALNVFLIAAVNAREWSDASGKFKIQGELQKLEGENVFIEREDGSVVKVPVAKLSAIDQAYLQARQPNASEEDNPFNETGPSASEIAPAKEKPTKPKPAVQEKPEEEIIEINDFSGDFTGNAKPGKGSKISSPVEVKDDSEKGVVRQLPVPMKMVLSVCFHPNAQTLAVTAHDELLVFDLASGKILSQHEIKISVGIGQGSSYSSDGSRFVVKGDENKIYLFDVGPSGGFKKMRTINSFQPKLESVLITGDSKSLLVAAGGQLALIALNDPANKATKISGSQGTIHAMWTSPDGKRAILATEKNSDYKLIHVDLLNKKIAKTVSAPMLLSGSFSSDGAVIAVGFPDGIKQISTANGREFFSIPGSAVAGRTVFSKSGRHLALSYFGVLSLFDVSSGKQLERVEIGSGLGFALDISSDNRLVAVASITDDFENQQPVLIYRFPALGP